MFVVSGLEGPIHHENDHRVVRSYKHLQLHHTDAEIVGDSR